MRRKEDEAHRDAALGAKKRRLLKEAHRTVAKVEETDAADLNYEKALQKTATRAVIALFNSIAKHQHGGADEVVAQQPSSGSSKKKKPDAAARKYGEQVVAVMGVRDSAKQGFEALTSVHRFWILRWSFESG